MDQLTSAGIAKRKDIYKEITDFVINHLESGNVIWRKGWNSLGLPRNIITDYKYRGWNLYYLNFIIVLQNYKTPYFLTYKQTQEKGAHIRKREKGYPVIYWAVIEDKVTSSASKQIQTEEKDGSPKTRLVPKLYTVFNIDQTDGLTLPKVEKIFKNHTQKIEACEEVLTNMVDKPVVKHQGDKTWYSRLIDTINMPNNNLFNTDADYYATLFHELSHSTGHEKRLNRKELIENDGFKENYSKEELTAELAATFLCGICGVEQTTLVNSTAYIQGWLKALKDDKTLIVKAASQAQAAAENILRYTNEKNTEETCMELAECKG
jgi:antirestriction protein ArdC